MTNALDGFIIEGGSTVTDLPPAVVKTLKILDGLPPKKLLTLEQLSSRVGVRPQYFSQHIPCRVLVPYRQRVTTTQGRPTFYGSRRAIARLRERIHAGGKV